MPVTHMQPVSDPASLHELDLSDCRVALLARASRSPFDRHGLQAFLATRQHDAGRIPETRTRVIAGKTQVVKIRHRHATFQEAWRTLQAYRRNERICRLQHPFKAWFILRCACARGKPEQISGYPWLIGNITPRLTSLAELFAQATGISGQHRFELLAETLRIYLLHGFRHGNSADPSLENFAVDPHGRIYYLDDEFYPADPLPALADFLAGLLRRHDWMGQTLILQLADFLTAILRRQPGGRRKLTALACALRNRFVAGPKQPLLRLLCHRLGRPNHDGPIPDCGTA